ncbi:signal peptidase I [Proteiniborus sp. DW1]|uniref:signal peptidase I n=1 Tax=Proteiniborus sp. DW1 TaxID=1889883 RepID=UPI00092E07FC|nr:signal peptidase I [Proteiniborus sp. DW1]SCG82966.1 signal peptidase I [Proteiniborus sp. DW1]
MKKNYFHSIIKVSRVLIILFSLAILIENYILGITIVSGESMMNTIEDNDRILVNKISYFFEKPLRGDVVIFNPPIEGREHELFIKRVIAVAGDYFEISDSTLYINGIAVYEEYINNNNSSNKEFKLLKGRVPEGHVFLLGDNRDNSNDSRVFGFVPIKSIKGKAITKLWPVGGFKSLAVSYEDKLNK